MSKGKGADRVDKKRVTVLHSYDTMPLFYTLYPFLSSHLPGYEFDFYASIKDCLEKDTNENLLITRIFNKGSWKGADIIPTMSLLRSKYKNITWLNDEDGTTLTRTEVFPYVDVYLKKQLLHDRGLYKEKIYKNLYAEYFKKEFNIDDNDGFTPEPINEQNLKKIHLAWNVGVGCYPRENFKRRIGFIAAKYLSTKLTSFFYSDPTQISFPNNREFFDVHARFNFSKRTTSNYQRELVLEKIGNEPRFLTGPVGLKQYQQEMNNSKIVISPFGLGEICFRDFEAILGGALLLKPDMGHIETWPNVYIPYKTYVPFSWDASDMMEKVNYYLKNDDERRNISRHAFSHYQKQLSGLDERAKGLILSFV